LLLPKEPFLRGRRQPIPFRLDCYGYGYPALTMKETAKISRTRENKTKQTNGTSIAIQLGVKRERERKKENK